MDKIKCVKCSNTLNKEQFKSLYDHKTGLNKTCIKCRLNTKKNKKPKPIKPKIIKEIKDYTAEYLSHLRCSTCKRKTDGLDDYKNRASGNITKTCQKCRNSVLKAVIKNKESKPKVLTMREKCILYDNMIKSNNLLVHSDNNLLIPPINQQI